MLGVAILWWMYRGFDWTQLTDSLHDKRVWLWVGLSMPFGILAQLFRAQRWQMTLEPLGHRVRLRTCLNAVFLSYASSLLVPRVGEVLRCGVLRRYEGVPFSQSVGTVVTERVVDMVLVLLIALGTFVMQIGTFHEFFARTGVSLSGLLERFTSAGWGVTVLCGVVGTLACVFVARRLAIFSRTRGVLRDLFDGASSVFRMRRWGVYLCYSFGIWSAYFLDIFITIQGFEFSAHLGWSVALGAFVVGCFAVLVPTPNGAGPWHFAVKTVLLLYGVAGADGAAFVLIVHTLQTLLVALLGLYAMVALAFIRPRKSIE